jgi:hypothetical protein
VEFDAHKLDLRLKILDQDPEGGENVLEIERVWLLALIDLGSRAILGYLLCLRREYSRYDVIRTFEKALTPMSLPAITIGDLQPLPSGGFASTTLPMRASGRDSLDPRIVRIKFTPLTSDTNSMRGIDRAGAKTSFVGLVCANLPTNDSIAA